MIAFQNECINLIYASLGFELELVGAALKNF